MNRMIQDWCQDSDGLNWNEERNVCEDVNGPVVEGTDDNARAYKNGELVAQGKVVGGGGGGGRGTPTQLRIKGDGYPGRCNGEYAVMSFDGTIDVDGPL